MNERIKELSTVAYEFADHYDRIGVDNTFQNIYNEKFAQLIVKECALQCIHNEDMDLIEKHFGV